MSNRWILFIVGALGFLALAAAAVMQPAMEPQLWKWAAAWLSFVAAAAGFDTARRFGGDRLPAATAFLQELFAPLLQGTDLASLMADLTQVLGPRPHTTTTTAGDKSAEANVETL